jgi:hypothetical protein
VIAEVALEDAIGVEADLLGVGDGCVGHDTEDVQILLFVGKAGVGIGTGFCGVKMGQSDVADMPGCVRADPYPLAMWAGYEGCRTYGLGLGCPVG